MNKSPWQGSWKKPQDAQEGETGGKEGRRNSHQRKAGTGGCRGEADEGSSEAPTESDHDQLSRGQQILCPSASQCLCPEDLLGTGTILHTGAHRWHKKDLTPCSDATLITVFPDKKTFQVQARTRISGFYIASYNLEEYKCLSDHISQYSFWKAVPIDVVTSLSLYLYR